MPFLLTLGAVYKHIFIVELIITVGLIAELGDAGSLEIFHFYRKISLIELICFHGSAYVPCLLLPHDVRDHPNPTPQGTLIAVGAYSEKCNDESFFKNTITEVDNGISKVISKMAIPTLQFYKAADLTQETIDLCFAGTPSRPSTSSLEMSAYSTPGPSAMCTKSTEPMSIRTSNCFSTDGSGLVSAHSHEISVYVIGGRVSRGTRMTPSPS